MCDMKRTLSLFWLLVLPFVWVLGAAPKWLTSHESTATEYYGLGMAPLNSENYMEKASENALMDIARQIMVKVQGETFLSMVEADNQIKETLAQKTQMEVLNFLTGQELVGRYSDKKTGYYYVCYKLNKAAYDAAVRDKSDEIASIGRDYLKQGDQSLAKGELQRAYSMYSRGLEAVEPWLFLPLRDVENADLHIPTLLWQRSVAIYDGLTLAVTPSHLQLSAFSPLSQDICVQVLRSGVPVVNMPVVAAFVLGTGELTREAKTDTNGNAHFLLSKVTGKQPVQTCRFSLSKMAEKEMTGILAKNMSVQTLPQAELTLSVQTREMKAYVNVTDDDLPALKKQMETILANNHFNLVVDPDDADIFIDLSTSLEIGGTVKGEIYDLNECLVSVRINFYDYKTNQLLSAYDLSQLRVLSNQQNTVEQTLAQCTREAMKRIQRELPQKLPALGN